MNYLCVLYFPLPKLLGKAGNKLDIFNMKDHNDFEKFEIKRTSIDHDAKEQKQQSIYIW